MPKQTFFNLPDEKREMILECAIDEFAAHGYEGASISRMVAAAKIAKGSFYQYFEDKEDLYCHVLDVAIVRRKMRVRDEEGKKLEEISFTQFIRLLFKNMMAEFLERPKLLQISTDFLRNQYDPVRQRIYGKYKHLGDNYFNEYIDYEKGRGELDPNVDTTVLSSLLIGAGYQIGNHAAIYGHEALTAEYIDDLADKIGYILTNGIYTNIKLEE